MNRGGGSAPWPSPGRIDQVQAVAGGPAGGQVPPEQKQQQPWETADNGGIN